MPPAISAEVPTSSTLVVGVNSRPRRSKRSCSARVQTDSVSSSRPSLSKTTASGRVGSMAGSFQSGLPNPARRKPVASRRCPSTSSHRAASTTPAPSTSAAEELRRRWSQPWLDGPPDRCSATANGCREESELRILEGPELSDPGPRLRPGLGERRAAAASTSPSGARRGGAPSAASAPPARPIVIDDRLGGADAGRARLRPRRPQSVAMEEARERIDSRDPRSRP